MQSLRQLEVGGILADDMGLGKTLQTLAHMLSEKNAGRLDRPCMVVMPTSLIPNWLDEAAHFTPQLKVLALYGASRKKHFDNLADYDLILTTYALLPKDVERLAAQPLHVLVLDEAQYIKNPNSKAAQAAARAERAPAPVPERHATGKPPGRAVVAVSFPAARLARRREKLQPRLPRPD